MIILPPELTDDKIDNYLKNIRNHCLALSVVELEGINDFSGYLLTAQEMKRFAGMGLKRKISYISARTTCKYLFWKLAGSSTPVPANEINTVFEDLPYPKCPFPDEVNPYNCSVSHDSRFAIAVASKKKIGVDVEEVSDRALNASARFMAESEISIVKGSGLGGTGAAVRIWSIKEAVTKALQMINMYHSWKITRVTELGENISIVDVNGQTHRAYHDIFDDHIFTVMEMD